MEYDSVLDQQSISGKNVSLILRVWKPGYLYEIQSHMRILYHTYIGRHSKLQQPQCPYNGQVGHVYHATLIHMPMHLHMGISIHVVHH